jgi:hypothetical protein
MIPKDIIETLEKQTEGLSFGKICLEISIHDNKPKYRIVKEISFIPYKKTSGSTGQQHEK